MVYDLRRTYDEIDSQETAFSDRIKFDGNSDVKIVYMYMYICVSIYILQTAKLRSSWGKARSRGRAGRAVGWVGGGARRALHPAWNL